jgi:predicted regulator of Ras-like GTPase activity (Roadblock/LC7/MglB family)
MDAAQALADLTEISSQIRAAILIDADGQVAASSGRDPDRAEQMARGARELLAAADETMGGAEARERLVQLQAATPDGCVFVVRDEGRVVAAVTVPDPTVGLVFYDLKTCLRHAAGENLAPKPSSRAADNGATDVES